jgi:Fungal Zn(2)-Cys(6) binuclear cluster domain
MDAESKKMRSFRGCTACKNAKRRCTEERPVCASCAKAGRECEVITLCLSVLVLIIV